MPRSWARLALATAVNFSTARAACLEIDQYFGISSPMTSDVEINLDAVDTIECEEIDGVYGLTKQLETVTVEGGTLTLKSSNSVRFVDVGFYVAAGANLVFDMPKTKFGPNAKGHHRGYYHSYTLRVEEGASAIFLGQVIVQEVINVYSLFRNAGTMEFRQRAVFQDGGSVLTDNTGVVKFGGNTTFKDNCYLALENLNSAYVSFEKDAMFDHNAFTHDGPDGCSVENTESSTIIFRGDATFQNNNCAEGGATVFNEGIMTFDGKAYFNENDNDFSSGGGANIQGGTTVFNKAVQFNNNTAGAHGGGINVGGGEVIFSDAVTFDGNTAESGSAFSVNRGGSITFMKPGAVISRDAVLSGCPDEGCIFGEGGGTVIGFSGDDVCTFATVAA